MVLYSVYRGYRNKIPEWSRIKSDIGITGISGTLTIIDILLEEIMAERHTVRDGTIKVLHSQLKEFNKTSLVKTETRITREDGQSILESQDNHGNFVTKETSEPLKPGYVLDKWMDFQVGKIVPGLIMGSQYVAAEWDKLEQHGVTHILNIATIVKNYFPDKIKYMNMNLRDHPKFYIVQHFDQAFKFISEGRSEGCVLIHCNAGISRASTMTIGYLMKIDNMDFEAAYSLVKKARPVMDPNEGFMKQLKTYDAWLKQERKEFLQSLVKQ